MIPLAILREATRNLQMYVMNTVQLGHGLEGAMLTPSDAVLKVAAMMKVGKTLGGSANLPAVHAPFTVEHQEAITDSLFLLP